MRVRGSGGGGKGGGGGGGGISESADTLSSVALARVVDAVGEGEIVGLVNGECSIYLDGVPVMNPDGSTNFTNYSWDSRTGIQTQDPMQAFSEAEEEYAVGVKVTKSQGIKWMPINDYQADYVRLTVSVPGLTTTSSSGNISGSEVQFRVYYKNGDNISPAITEPLHTETIKGKTRSKYQRSIKLQLEGFGGWLHWAPAYVGIERITDDSNSSLVQNDLYWDSYTVINTEKFSYPNTALIGMQVDARKFSSVPSRSYHVQGLLIKVPSNYEPLTRTYDGVWDGTWKIAYSNNPAWVLYDLLTSTRYGLGKRLDPGMIDKAALYEIARYCDEPVPTGYDTDTTYHNAAQGFDAFGNPTAGVPTIVGGTEPRFTINCTINTKDDAYKVINNITSVFRGMSYWRSGGVTFTQDRPEAAQMLFTAANVIDGMFTYQGSSRSQRHSVCYVAWNDPSNNFKQSWEYVEDREAIARYGVRSTEVVAFGCTSRSQARRVGLWLLYTERLETDAVTFRAAMDSFFLMPGNIVSIHDPMRAGKRLGGRILSMTDTSVTIDSPVELSVGSHTLGLLDREGKIAQREINITAPGPYSVLSFSLPISIRLFTWDELDESIDSIDFTWDEAYTIDYVAHQMWTLATPDVEPLLARVISMKEVERNIMEITVVEHNPTKYGAVERGDLLELPTYSALTLDVPPITGLSLTETTYRALPQDPPQTVVIASWDKLASTSIRGYVVSILSNGNTVTLPETTDATLELHNLSAGDATVTVQAISVTGSKGGSATATITVIGEDNTPPSDVTDLAITMTTDKRYALSWTPVVDFINYYEVRIGATWATSTLIDKVKATSITVPPMLPGDYKLWVVALDGSGLASANPASIDLNIPELADPTGLSVTASVGSVTVQVDEAEHPLFAGIEVYLSTTSGFTPGTATLVYKGTNTQTLITKLHDGSSLPVNTEMYIKVRYYSLVGDPSNNYTSQVAVTLESFSANMLRLTSESQVFNVSASGTPTPSTISFTAVLSGTLSGVVTWSVSGGTLTGTGNTRTLDYSSLTGTSATVTASLTKDGVTYSDSITAVKVVDGASGVTAFLTNEAVALPSYSDGSIISYNGASTQIKVYVGTTDDTANWTVTRVDQAGLTTTLSGNTVTATALTNDASYSTITATKGATAVSKVFSVSRVKQGSAGDWTTYVFKEAASQPTKPTGTAIIPSGWLDSPPATYSNPIWMSKGSVTGSTGLVSSWSTPTRITGNNGTNGVDGDDGTYVVFQYAKSTSSTVAPSSWVDTPPSLSAGEYMWMRNGTVTPPATSPATWTSGYRVSGEQGPKGDSVKGDPGSRGSIQAYRTITGSTWSDTEANAAILAFTGSSTKIIGDTVTLSNAGASFSGMKFWDGTSWLSPGTVIDGNLLVNGTVAGNKLAANSITAASGVIADLAVTTSKIADATVSSAKIADAAITTAKIGDAQVNTLKIASNAVSSSVIGTGSSISVTVQAGETITIFVSPKSNGTSINQNQAPTTTLKRDGTSIASFKPPCLVYYTGDAFNWQLWSVLADGTLSYQDTPGAGTFTYSVSTTYNYVSSYTWELLILKR